MLPRACMPLGAVHSSTKTITRKDWFFDKRVHNLSANYPVLRSIHITTRKNPIVSVKPRTMLSIMTRRVCLKTHRKPTTKRSKMFGLVIKSQQKTTADF